MAKLPPQNTAAENSMELKNSAFILDVCFYTVHLTLEGVRLVQLHESRWSRDARGNEFNVEACHNGNFHFRK